MIRLAAGEGRLLDRTHLHWLHAALLCLLAIPVAAEDRPEILLFPQGVPAPAVPTEAPERIEKGADGTSRRFNVSKPRLFVYRPAAGSKASKAGVIVVPGGGFGRLADEHEGSETCQWLAKNGVTAFMLAYRTPTNMHPDPSAGPVQDLQKAVIEVRKRALEYGLDPALVGVLGYSAGGQVALTAATNDPKFEREAGATHRPGFLLAVYPYRIYDPATKGLRADIRVAAGLPPTFIAQMSDDTASLAQGSALLYLELLNRKVPAELHIYEKGGHGFGMRPRPGAAGPTDWSHRALDWLRLRGYAPAP
ncbi:MAG: alpha/beta hydrolase [Actinomycetota bacterium]